jgi:hypothetical protein
MKNFEEKGESEEQHVPASVTRIVYNPAQWHAFVKMLERAEIDPDIEKPRLRKLLNEPSVLDSGLLG